MPIRDLPMTRPQSLRAPGKTHLTQLKIAVVLAAALAVGGAGTAIAQSAAAKAVTERQAGFKRVGGAFKTINDQLKAGEPDLAAIRTAAAAINASGSAQYRWFPRGSGPAAGVKTKAKAEIWSDGAGFAVAQRAYQVEAAKLQRFAAAGDVEGMKQQAKALGGACGGCHKKYREE